MFQMPTAANGNVFDDDIAHARGDNLELTLLTRVGTVVRLLAYQNHARIGDYSEAIARALERDTVPSFPDGSIAYRPGVIGRWLGTIRYFGDCRNDVASMGPGGFEPPTDGL
jgi:hypothetical protein